MTIWVDADACPRPIKDILCRAAVRCSVLVCFVANQSLQLPASPFIRSIQVPKGFDVADNEIVKRCEQGDLLVSQDIPLAAEVIEKFPDLLVLTPYGDPLTAANIRQRLQMRNMMESLRNDYGQQTGGRSAFGNSEAKAFADRLDRYLAGCRKA